MKALAERHRITLFTFYPEYPDDKHHELSAVFDRVIALPLPIPTGRGPRELASTQLSILKQINASRYVPFIKQHWDEVSKTYGKQYKKRPLKVAEEVLAA